MNENLETKTNQRRTLTLREAAERLNSSERHVRREIHLGNLPAWRKGGKELMVESLDLEAYIELQKERFAKTREAAVAVM